MATAVALAPRPESDSARPPNPWLLGAIAIVGCAVPVRSIALALTSDHVDLVQVALLDWITVPYILAGLVAWVRRPESRLGLLMIAGGFASGLSALQLTHVDALYTVGAVFDILPAGALPARLSRVSRRAPRDRGSSEPSFRPPTPQRSDSS